MEEIPLKWAFHTEKTWEQPKAYFIRLFTRSTGNMLSRSASKLSFSVAVSFIPFIYIWFLLVCSMLMPMQSSICWGVLWMLSRWFSSSLVFIRSLSSGRWSRMKSNVRMNEPLSQRIPGKWITIVLLTNIFLPLISKPYTHIYRHIHFAFHSFIQAPGPAL